MIKEVVAVFEELKKYGLNVTLLDCDIDDDAEEDHDEPMYWVAFTVIDDAEEIRRQRDLLKEDACTPDTIEEWSTLDEMPQTVKNSAKLWQANKEGAFA